MLYPAAEAPDQRPTGVRLAADEWDASGAAHPDGAAVVLLLVLQDQLDAAAGRSADRAQDDLVQACPVHPAHSFQVQEVSAEEPGTQASAPSGA